MELVMPPTFSTCGQACIAMIAIMGLLSHLVQNYLEVIGCLDMNLELCKASL